MTIFKNNKETSHPMADKIKADQAAKQTWDTIIVGGGTAGLGAALYAKRYSLSTLVIAKDFGGTGNEAHLVDNWMGDPGITGMALMDKFINHVKQLDVPLLDGEVIATKKHKKGFKTTIKSGGKEHTLTSKTIILCTGMTHNKLQVPGEKEFAKKGVSYCYTCDAAFYKDKTVSVVGGSDSAAQAALLLTEYAKKVYVFYRKDKLRAEPITTEKVYNHKKIEVMHNVNVKEIKGDKFVTSVILDNKKEVKLDGVFVQIGAKPNPSLSNMLGVKLDKRDFIIVDNEGNTSVPGVYAAGDMTNATSLKQFITSAAEGSKAAQQAYLFVNK